MRKKYDIEYEFDDDLIKQGDFIDGEFILGNVLFDFATKMMPKSSKLYRHLFKNKYHICKHHTTKIDKVGKRIIVNIQDVFDVVLNNPEERYIDDLNDVFLKYFKEYIEWKTKFFMNLYGEKVGII